MDSIAPRVLILVGVMGSLALLEVWLPYRHQRRDMAERWRPNLLLTALFLAMNLLLTLGVVGLASEIEAERFGVLHALPAWLAFVLSIILLDLFAYLAHALMHRVPWLWRIHRVHHSDEAVDVTTTFRQHPLETLLRFAFTSIPAVMLGATATATAAYRLVSGINALLEHANIGLPDRLERWLNRVVVTPQMHKIHHADDAARTDSNYGNILSIFDRLFGTHTPSSEARPVRYGLGLPGTKHKSASGLLALPFTESRSEPLVHAPR